MTLRSLRSFQAWGCAALAFVAVASLLLATPSAAAKRKAKKGDVEAPVITHAPSPQYGAAGPLIIEATIVDDSGVFDPTLLVRGPGGAFERIAMKPVDGKPDTFAAEVPAALLGGDLEYLIEAYDENGNGPARAGDEATPLRIAFVAAVAQPIEQPPHETPPGAATTDEDNGALVWGAGIAVGSVILLGAAAGIGLAVFALFPATPDNVTVSITGGSPIAAAAP